VAYPLAVDLIAKPRRYPNENGNPMRWLEYTIFILIALALVRPHDLYLARVFDGGKTSLDPVLRPARHGR
jgi:hypothetical protein